MRLRILPSAVGDLDRGRRFYARRGQELGEYFLNSLFADIDALALYAGVPWHTLGSVLTRARQSIQRSMREVRGRSSGQAQTVEADEVVRRIV